MSHNPDNTIIHSSFAHGSKSKQTVDENIEDAESVDCAKKNNNKDSSKIITKVNQLTRGQKPYNRRLLIDILCNSPENVNKICDFIAAERDEINIKDSTAEWHIKVLARYKNILVSRILKI